MAGAGRLDVRLGLDAAEYTAGLDRAAQDAQKFERTLDSLSKSLKTQIETFGFSARQLTIYELAQKGATREQLLSINALYLQKEAMTAAASAASKAVTAAADAQKAAAANSAAIDKQVQTLHDHVAVQGRSAREAKLYELTQQGATKAQLESADAALKQRAAYEATTKFMGDLKVAAIAAGVAIAGIAVAGAVVFEKLLGKAANFQDLAEKTGASAEALASFQSAAAVTGTSMETLANLSVKLTKGLAGTDEETKQAANALKQIGINVEEFRKLDPGAQFEEIAKHLKNFADGSGKTAFAVAAMGRSGADALPFLKELGEQGRRNVGLTAEQIKAADDYKDAQKRLTAEVELYAQKLAITALGPISDFKKALFETAKQIFGLQDETAKLADSKDIEKFAEGGARSLDVLLNIVDLIVRGFQLAGNLIAATAAQITALADRNLAGVKQIRDEATAASRAIVDRPLFSSNRQEQQQRRERENELANDPERRRLLGTVGAFRPKEELDSRNFGSGRTGGSKTDKELQDAKKHLEDNLSTLDNFIREEHQKLESRNNALERLYNQDKISSEAYFAGRSDAQFTNVVETEGLYREEIAKLQEFYEYAKKKKNDIAALGALTKIGDLTRESNIFRAKASDQATKDFDASARAAQEYQDKVSELNSKILDLAGSEEKAGEAARRRFDIQTRSDVNKFIAKGDQDSVDKNNILRERVGLEAELNKVRSKGQLIQDELALTEGRIALDRQRGVISEIASYNARGDAARLAVSQLQEQADAYRALADELKDPAFLILAKRIQLEIDQIAASADILANKLRTDFKEAADTALEGFLDNLQHGKGLLNSFKEAFTAFVSDITRQINKLAAQSITDALFKGNSSSGGGGGIGTAFSDFIASLFGGQSLTGVFASGTDFVPRDGPAYLHRGERVVTAEQNRSGGAGWTIQNTFVLPPGGVTRETQNQIAERAGRSIRFAQSRNS